MRVPPIVPEEMKRATTAMRGMAGAEWLDRLPALITEIEERWSLEIGPPFPGIWATWVAPARLADDGVRAILKLSFPGDEEFGTQVAALRLFDGRGISRLLRLDLDLGATLIERCEPGAPLLVVEDDEEATIIAAGVMEKLWRPVPERHPFPLVSDWARGFERLRRRYAGGTGPMPAALVERAEALFADLVPTQAEPRLLHGDLHHENILSARREPWLAIDPKGVVGEPAYDTAAMLHNPVGLLDEPRPGRALGRRVDLLSERLDLDRSRVRGWALAQAVLAAYWGLEDGGRVWDEALVFARLIAGLES